MKLFLVLNRILVDFGATFWRAPVWWYGRGLILALKTAKNSVAQYAKTIGIGVWTKNLFVPMFGLYDWQSRIISFFMRLFQIVARLFLFVVWTFIVLIGLLLYISLPVAAILGSIYHLSVIFV